MTKAYAEQLKKSRLWTVRVKNAYTPEYKELVLAFLSMGMSQRHIGRAIAQAGHLMGVNVSHVIDRRSISRIVDEVQVAVEIQNAFEIHEAPGRSFMFN